MPYCTPSDVRAIIPLIDESTMPDEQIQVFITKAESYIDSKLRGIYAVPFNPVPSLIRDIAIEYTAYLVLRTIYFQNTPNQTEIVGELKENVNSALSGLVEGELYLDAPSIDIGFSVSSPEEKVFSMNDITPIKRGWS